MTRIRKEKDLIELSLKSFDYVAANLITHDLIGLKRKIFLLVNPGKFLTVSGISTENAPRLIDLFLFNVKSPCLDGRRAACVSNGSWRFNILFRREKVNKKEFQKLPLRCLKIYKSQNWMAVLYKRILSSHESTGDF